MKPFFIYALPRSGTAWLANYLTYGNTFCYHELLADRFSVDRMKEKLEGNGSEFVGNSDSANLFFFNEISKTFPNAKSVVVTRDPEEVMRSMIFQGYSDECLSSYESSLNILYGIHKHTDSIILDHKDLFNEYHAREILGHVTEHEGKFNKERFDFLKNTNVQVGNLHMKNKIEQCRSMGMD